MSLLGTNYLVREPKVNVNFPAAFFLIRDWKKEDEKRRKSEIESKRDREREEVKGIKNEFRILGWQCWSPHLDGGLTPAVF
jgi:hypothetical protein